MARQPGLLARRFLGLALPLRSSGLLRRLLRDRKAVQLPTSARMATTAGPCCYLRWRLIQRTRSGLSWSDVYLPGMIRPSTPTQRHRLAKRRCSRSLCEGGTQPAYATIQLSAHSHTRHGSCLHFRPRTTATPARFGTGLPPAALARSDLRPQAIISFARPTPAVWRSWRPRSLSWLRRTHRWNCRPARLSHRPGGASACRSRRKPLDILPQ